MRHIIDAIAAQGRGDDTELLHVTKGEMAGLDALARKHFGRPLPRNPKTGIKEASLFRDWFGNDVGMALDVAAPVAVGFIPGVGVPAAMAMGAGLGAANQGLGKNGTTESALIGGIAGGIGAYGGSGLAEGLSGAGAASTSATTPAAGAEIVTPTAEFAPLGGDIAASAPTDVGTIAQAAPTPPVAAPVAPTTPAPAEGFAPFGGDTAIPAGKNIVGGPLQPEPSTPTNWDFLKSKEAIGPATKVGTSAMMVAGLPGSVDTTGTTTTTTNKTLPKSEVYYTPYGERRTRLVAAEGGLMGLANGEYGDYDGADEEDNPRRYAGGGIAMIRQLQPGGEWGGMTADMYGAVQEQKPQWLQNAEPGGFIGATVPGKMDYEDKKRAEAEAEERKKREAEAAIKAQQEQAVRQGWADRYGVGMAGGGIAALQAQPRAGVSNVGFAKGRYLQGPGDGMSDSIPASIDGKQEARLATGEFVVPADVVSHLGNGDSNAGAKQLHSMMDRARMSRTGTKKQGKQINPRKVMPA